MCLHAWQSDTTTVDCQGGWDKLWGVGGEADTAEMCCRWFRRLRSKVRLWAGLLPPEASLLVGRRCLSLCPHTVCPVCMSPHFLLIRTKSGWVRAPVTPSFYIRRLSEGPVSHWVALHQAMAAGISVWVLGATLGHDTLTPQLSVFPPAARTACCPSWAGAVRLGHRLDTGLSSKSSPCSDSFCHLILTAFRASVCACRAHRGWSRV